MSQTEEEGRRWRRRSRRWRFIAAALLVALLVAVFWEREPSGDHIARYELLGVIVDDPARDDLLADVAADDTAKALMLRIESPGGTTVGSEALFESIRSVAARKPVVAVLGEVAASGGYIAAIAADRIVARGNTLTGSIGVIMQIPNYEELMETVGVEIREVKSGPLKAQPNPFSTASEEVMAHEQALIEDSFDWFKGLVGERRGLEGAALAKVADGRILTGRQALSAGLVDEVGGETAALAWLRGEGGVESGLPVRDVALADEDESLLAALIDRVVGRALGRSGRSSTGLRLFSILK